MEKVIKNNKVAVLISRGYGAGWYSWSGKQELLFHPKLIEMVESGKKNEITESWIKDNLGIDNVYCGGTDGLDIIWLDEGCQFRITEYDGAEAIETLEDASWITA